MNSRTSEDRVKWTTAALNHFLPLFRSILNLHHSKTPENKYKFVANTEQDATTLFEWISKLLIGNRGSIRAAAAWNCKLFYEQESDIDVDLPSDGLEQAFGNVADVFIKNQRMLVAVDEVELNQAEEEFENELHDVNL